MTQRRRTLGAVTVFGVSAVLPLSGCRSDDVQTIAQSLTAVCIDDEADVSEEEWLCPEAFTMECGFVEGDDEVVYVTPPEGQSCDDVDPDVDPGPYAPGPHAITIRDEGGDVLCRSELTVVDTVAPRMDLTQLELWPPNHEMVTITPEDCGVIEDACDPDVRTFFTSVSSNEVPEGRGDGMMEPDIDVVDCQTVLLRSERSGLGQGRVYQLGVRAMDESGLSTDGTCEVVVPHSQGRGPMPNNHGETMITPDPNPAYRFDVAPCPEDVDMGAAGAGGDVGVVTNE